MSVIRDPVYRVDTIVLDTLARRSGRACQRLSRDGSKHGARYSARAYDQKDVEFRWIERHRRLKGLEGDPHHEAFLKKLNVPEWSRTVP